MLAHFLDNRLTNGGKLWSLSFSRLLSPERFLVLISVGGKVDTKVMARLEGLEQINSMTSSGI
jgi:hypothetical protein